ncbi:NADH:ubiquinone reductase (Na(+)-transporting) subunit C [PVC group bacterium (ex Bugula neritina AB1)]|nr:NADH:ubiquinone reductase (Na(+)-transporting) subunit C [PVC group bacterium (ex Bugula neritina AB1)]
MLKNSDKYTFLFATAVCLICGFLLSSVAALLKDRQTLNIEVDIKKNVLKAVRLENPLSPKATSVEVKTVYAEKIEEKVIDTNGKIISDVLAKDVNFEEKTDWMPLYIYKEGEKIKAYCYPVSGKGLWSTLYGYFSVESDGKTVRGISFYKHGETPGLGAEIEKSWFQDNFKGKLIWSDEKSSIQPIAVVKGKVKNLYSGKEASHYVDGISGATITCAGVTSLLAKAIKKYEVFFKIIRN